MDLIDFRDTIEKLGQINEKLEKGQAELRQMLLALSSQKGQPNSERSASLGGYRKEKPRASLASSMERDRMGVGVQHDDAVEDTTVPVASISTTVPEATKFSFAEIALLDSLAHSSQTRSAMDSRGSGDIHIKQSVVFSEKMKGITPKAVLFCLRKVIQHMSENPSQRGLVASEICTDSVRDTIVNENSLTKIKLSRLTVLCSKEAAAKTGVQYVNKLRSINHWPGGTWHLLRYNMNDIEPFAYDLNTCSRSFTDVHDILAWGLAEQYAPKKGGGKLDRPAHYRSMIPNGICGVLHRLFEKEHPNFDYKVSMYMRRT
jgi:hypothetical protein